MTPSAWISQRLRSALIRENSMIFVLRILSEAPNGEWEVLDKLQARYGATPSSKEFGRLVDALVTGGYLHEEAGEADRLMITSTGLELLRRLEEECSMILDGLDGPPGFVLTR